MTEILFIVATTFLMMTIYSNYQMKKQHQKYMEKMDEYRELYSTLSSETFDELDNDTLRNAIVARLTLKKEEHVNLRKHLTHGEEVVYTFFLVENAFKSGRGTLYDFFIGETSRSFIDILVPSFEELGSNEGALIMKDALALNDKYIREEAGEEVEYKEDEETFEDFNQRYMRLRANSNLQECVDTYIRQHKEEFID